MEDKCKQNFLIILFFLGVIFLNLVDVVLFNAVNNQNLGL